MLEKLLTFKRKYSSLLEKHKKFECLIHGDEEPLHLGPSFSSATKCDHDPNVCRPCLKVFLERAIREAVSGMLDVQTQTVGL